MKRSTTNQGIVIGGSGRLQADVLAVGERARATKQVSADGAAVAEVQAQLAALRKQIEEESRRLPDAHRLKEALTSVAAELERERPSGLAMTSILDGVAQGAQKVTAIAKAALGLKVLIAQLFV